MLTGFLRTIVLFFVTAVVLRLMGKRQLAQLQPYEVVITLMISDLATLPMADVEIPLLSGVVSILTLLLVHSLLSALSYASVRMRRIICGRPSVLVRDGKICEKELARLCFDLRFDGGDAKRRRYRPGRGRERRLGDERLAERIPIGGQKTRDARGNASAAGL